MTDHPHMNRGRAELIPPAARAGGGTGSRDRAQRHERRRGAFGQSDGCSDRPVMLLVEGCSPQECTVPRASIRGKGVVRNFAWTGQRHEHIQKITTRPGTNSPAQSASELHPKFVNKATEPQ